MLALTTDYLRLRKLGLSPITAFKNTRKVNTRLESVIITVSLCVAVVWSINVAYAGYKTLEHKQTVTVNNLKHALRKATKQATHYENVLIGCLNNSTIIVANRNKQCIIRDFKDAVS